MKKILSTAAMAVLLGGLANAEWRGAITLLQIWEPLAYRTSDSTDEQRENAHTLEMNGEAAGTVGDDSFEETGLAFLDWDTNKNRYMGMSLKSDHFGASATFKFAPNLTWAGNGYLGWANWGPFEVRFSGNANIGWGDVTNHCSSPAYGWECNTASLYEWEIERLGAASKKDVDDNPYYIYNTSSAGAPILNKDGGYQLGIAYTKQFSNKKQLILRLVEQSGGRYTDNSSYGNMQPCGFNFQANFTMPKWAFSSTFKIRGSEWEDYKPIAADFSYNGAISTTVVPNFTFGLGYTLGGMNVNSETTVTADTNGDGNYAETKTVSKTYYGHGLNFGVLYKYKDMSFNFSTATTLIFLSEYNEALSDLNKYGWKPYLGEVISFGVTKPLTENMTGNIGFGFNDYNFNSRTSGKAEATFWLRPNVTIQAARGTNINIALNTSLSNFSDEAKGWWGQNSRNTICYTYPKTLYVSIPVTFNIML